MKRRMFSRLVGEHLQQGGLRDQPRLGPAQPGRFGPHEQASAGIDFDLLHLAMRQPIELRLQPHLPENIDSAPLQALSAKRAAEVAMRFQHGHLDSPPRQQIGERHPRRSGADNNHPPELSCHDSSPSR